MIEGIRIILSCLLHGRLSRHHVRLRITDQETYLTRKLIKPFQVLNLTYTRLWQVVLYQKVTIINITSLKTIIELIKPISLSNLF